MRGKNSVLAVVFLHAFSASVTFPFCCPETGVYCSHIPSHFFIPFFNGKCHASDALAMQFAILSRKLRLTTVRDLPR
jgi:hypothetical protein